MGKCDDESAACKQDVKDYNNAAFDKQTAEGKIAKATSDIDTYGKLEAAAALLIGGGLTARSTRAMLQPSAADAMIRCGTILLRHTL